MKKKILTLALVFALLVALVIPASVALAAANDSTEGTGDIVGASIDVVAPSDLLFGTFAVGVNSVASATDGSVTVTENSQSPTGYSVTAMDLNQAGDSGYMLTAGPTPLSNELQISDDDTTYAGASTGLTYADASLTGVLALYAEQTIGGSETAGAYTITIEFAGTITF